MPKLIRNSRSLSPDSIKKRTKSPPALIPAGQVAITSGFPVHRYKSCAHCLNLLVFQAYSKSDRLLGSLPITKLIEFRTNYAKVGDGSGPSSM